MNQNAPLADTSWKVIGFAIAIFIILLIVSSISLWLAYENNQFSSDDTERAIKAVMVIIVASAIFLPILYLLYTYIKVQNTENKKVHPSKIALLIIIIVSSCLNVLSCSLGIWMAHNFNTGAEISQSVFLGIGILMLSLYCIFYFKNK